MVTTRLPLPALLKLFSDPTRLRIMGLLEREELSVGELSRAIGMAQSRVSNHLRILRESGILSERHEGASTHVRVLPSRNGGTAVSRLWSAFSEEISDLPEHRADLARLDEVLAARESSSFFDRVAGNWDKIAGDFETGQARQRVAAHLLPEDYVVADLGCGQGYFAGAFLDRCSRLICLDRSRPMLDKARKTLSKRVGSTRVDFVLGEIDRLALADGAVDGVIAGMVLHHLDRPDEALLEMRRIVRDGGTAVVVELAPHREEWVRERLGDRHLGLDASDVVAAFERAGFEGVALDSVPDRYCPVGPGETKDVRLPLYIASGRVPRLQ